MTGTRQVFDDLVRFETMLWSAVDARLQAESGVTLGAVNVMLVLEAVPQCRVLDIAQRLAITVGGASQAVDRLAAAGHCSRRAHPSDRRSSIVELTADGAATLTRAAPVFDDELERRLRGPLSAEAFGSLGAALADLRRAAGTGERKA